MKRKPANESEDSEVIAASIQQIIDADGRGGMASMARSLGMSPNALLKRLRRPASAFDGPTARAVLVIEDYQRQQTQ